MTSNDGEKKVKKKKNSLEEKCKILEVDQLLKKVKQHEHMESAHLLSQHSLQPEKKENSFQCHPVTKKITADNWLWGSRQSVTQMVY